MTVKAEWSLERLQEEERALSTRRARLHDKIDFLHGSGVDEPERVERLARMQEEEKEISRVRRELHALIDARRAG